METPKQNWFRRIEKKWRRKRAEAKRNAAQLLLGITSVQSLYDLTLFHNTKQRQGSSANPLNSFGKKCFSQTDEDGITIEILRRLNLFSNGVFAEFGVGNGMENNTLVLAALGWKGFWVGGEVLKPIVNKSAVARFCYLRDWITLENILALTADGLKKIGSNSLDVISLDLDGNDIYLVEALLAAKFTPKLFIVENNGKFPPPVEFQIAYDAQHQWREDDYFGASLASYVKLFAKFDYKLVCCNSHTGANAFFVQNQYAGLFSDVPTDIGALYVEPTYWLYQRHSQNGAVRTVEEILNRP